MKSLFLKGTLIAAAALIVFQFLIPIHAINTALDEIVFGGVADKITAAKYINSIVIWSIFAFLVAVAAWVYMRYVANKRSMKEGLFFGFNVLTAYFLIKIIGFFVAFLPDLGNAFLAVPLIIIFTIDAFQIPGFAIDLLFSWAVFLVACFFPGVLVGLLLEKRANKSVTRSR